MESSKQKRRKLTKKEFVPDFEYPLTNASKTPSGESLSFDEQTFKLFGDDMLGLSQFDHTVDALFCDDVVGTNTASRQIDGSEYFASCSKNAFSMNDEKTTTVWISNCYGEYFDFNPKGFAGFLLKFVEKARLLSSENLLHNFNGYQEKQLMTSVLANFESTHPFRELVENAGPYVARVLLCMLKEVPSVNLGIKTEESRSGRLSFHERIFLVFNLPDDCRRDVEGKNFQTFLSFLLEASLMPADVIDKSKATQDKSVFGMFASNFKREMMNLVIIAHRNLTKMSALQ